MKRKKLKKVLRKLDGIVFTGGSQPYYRSMHVDDINQFLDNIQLMEKGHRVHPDFIIQRKKTRYFKALSFIMKEARKINDSGRSLPIWGICLGFEGMLLNDGETHVRLNQFKDRNKTHGIKVLQTDMDNLNGSFAKFIKDHYANRSQEKYFFHYHIRGFTPMNFYSDPYLKNKYNILAVSDQNDNIQDRRLEADPFNSSFYKDLKHNKIVIDKEDKEARSRKLELTITRIVNYKSPFKVRKLQDEAGMAHIKTDFRTNPTLFVGIVENKQYPFYGMQFHPEKSIYDFHRNKHVQTTDENRWNNEMLQTFFMEKVISGKVNYLKKLLNLENDAEAYKNLLRKKQHSKREEKQLFILSKLRDYVFQNCKIQAKSKGCRRFDYNLLKDLNSNYQKALSEQILADYDRFYNKNFNKTTGLTAQKKWSTRRLLIRNISVFDEIILHR
jgi:anthranilate/para-aminobenzoate synthase component II